MVRHNIVKISLHLTLPEDMIKTKLKSEYTQLSIYCCWALLQNLKQKMNASDKGLLFLLYSFCIGLTSESIHAYASPILNLFEIDRRPFQHNCMN